MSAGLKSKCNFVFFMALVHLHMVLLFGFLLSRSTTEGKTCSKLSVGCPIKATKSFFGRQMAFLGQSITNVDSMSTIGLDVRLSTRNLNMVLDRPTFLSRKFFRDIRLQNLNMVATATSADTTTSNKKERKPTGGLEVIVLGLSHHHASVDVREKLAIPEDQWKAAAAEMCNYDSISEAAVLSTCNRFEVYLAGSSPYACVHDAMDYMMKRAGGTLTQDVLRSNLFMLSGEDAVWHLLRVSAGLDSLIVGEGQILAQVKRAYEHGVDEGGQAGKVVSRMLNTAVSAGKRVRSETGISRGAVSISSAAAEFSAMKLLEDCGVSSMEQAKIAIIGAGKMARLLVVHLASMGVKEITVVNRSPERVEELQKEFPDLIINCRLMPDMWDVLRTSDIVYPSTAATTTIIDPAPLQECMEQRRREGSRSGGLQLVDISVPRNVHADCSTLEGVASYNVDDLKAVVERNTAKRRREMVEAEHILRDELDKYRLWQLSLGAVPTIARLQVCIRVSFSVQLRLKQLLSQISGESGAVTSG